MSYVFSFTFFSLPLIFTLHWWPLAFLILSPLLQKKMPPLFFFLIRPRSLSPFFSRWASLASRLLPFFPVFLCRTQKQFPLSVFVFIDSLTVSALQDAGGYAISRQNNLELHLGYHTCWLSYFTLVCLWCGRTAGHVRSRDYQISGMGRFTYPWCFAGALRVRELRYNFCVSLRTRVALCGVLPVPLGQLTSVTYPRRTSPDKGMLFML